MKTSIDFLLGELLQNKLLALRYDKDDTMNEIVAKAKEMHKQEIINTVLDVGSFMSREEAEQYYQETFKKD
jgi:hypothetical protein